jgi:hypothetical protein
MVVMRPKKVKSSSIFLSQKFRNMMKLEVSFELDVDETKKGNLSRSYFLSQKFRKMMKVEVSLDDDWLKMA